VSALPRLVPAGPSPAGWSLMGSAGRCLALWGFDRPAEATVDDDGGAPPTCPEDVIDPEAGRCAPNQLHRDYHLPFLRGILAHDALAQSWTRWRAEIHGQDPAEWATWQYAIGYDLVYASSAEPTTPEAAAAVEARARQVAAWIMAAPPASRMDRIAKAVECTRPDLRVQVDVIAGWHLTHWREERRQHVEAVEEPVRLWLDPRYQDDAAANPCDRYGVRPTPADEATRLRLYRALRGPHWRHALRFLRQLGAPWLSSSRLDMRFRDTSRNGGRWIVDLKSGFSAGKSSEHRAYQHSGQIILIDIYGRCFVPDYRGFMLQYLPWVGRPETIEAKTAEIHRRSFAHVVQHRMQRLFAHVDLPVSRWDRVLDIQGCRTVYDDPCPHYDRCRTDK
jgi:hypothetical protein